MKLRYLLSLFALSALFLAGCAKDEPNNSLKNIQVSKTFLSIAPAGGSESVKITASVDWLIVSDIPDWLSVSEKSGKAGSEMNISFSAQKCDYGRQAELQIKAGVHTQFITVRQGEMTVEVVSCAKAMSGTAGKTYCVEGAVTSIVNTTYGNLYINDGSGVEAYIYGTLDKNGAEKNFSSLGIEVGDIINVTGPLTYYGTTPELVNVTVNKITKSLLKVIAPSDPVEKEGGLFIVKAAYKGNGVFVQIPDEYASWVSTKNMEYIAGIPSKLVPSPADTALISFSLAPNPEGARVASINISSASGTNVSNVTVSISQDGAIVEINCKDFNAQPDGNALFKVRGTVTKIAKDDQDKNYTNFYIKDYSGEEVYVYGTYTADGTKISAVKEYGLKEGDIVTMVGKKGSYKGTNEMLNGYFEELMPVETVDIATFRGLADDKTKFYRLTGVVSQPTESGARFDIDTYGYLALVDGTGEIYVYGTSTGVNGESKKFGTLGVKEGDTMTIIAYKGSYKGLNEACGAMYVSHAPKPE